MNWLAFTNPWLLAGLAMAGLPVLIHFLTRARPRRIIYPPYRFLVEACAGQQAVHRLRTILLLAIRTLAVLALVLLFARPFLRPAATRNTEQNKRVVLIVDASLSMRAVQRGVPLFSRAKAEAEDILRGLESSTEAAVVLEGARPRALLPALSRNLPALHDELVKAQPTFEYGDPGAALALAKQMLGGAGTIYILSDFQKSNWSAVDQLPGGVLWRSRNVAPAPVDNVAITETKLVPAAPIAGEPVEIVCTVFNCTARPREQTVRLDFADFTHETRVALPPFAKADAVFNETFPRAGSFAGKVSIDPDDFPEDNTRHLAVQVHKALQVLLVSDAEEDDQNSAAFYISRALVPSQQAAPGLKLVRRHSQDADRGILETAEVFVLVAPAMLSGEAVEIISRRVHEGARVVSFLDGPTSPMLMLPGLNPPFQLQRALASVSGDAVVAGPRRFSGDLDPADFSSLRFRRHYQNVVFTNRQSEVLLGYGDGSAALTLSPAGSGVAVLANLPLTPDGTDFIGSPLFPAMMHELLRLLRRDAGEQTISPGAAWTLDVPTLSEGALNVIAPNGHVVESKVLASGRTTRLAVAAVNEPGDYKIRQGDAVIADAVVNVDPRESDTRPMALDGLKSAAGAPVSVTREDEELSLTQQNRQLWPQLAVIAAALLALEMVLLSLWRRPLTTPIRSGHIHSKPSRSEAEPASMEAVR